ncbi:MAG: UDP-N-acetylglucosamine 2-epimerase [Acidobacteria bacterium OLB17]|nr:MAG: UDP-N-acetylglucosamine 2-epimerase [Acidobacteria bacterium OLB17]MCZ2390234.1 UDP-N-acetylglucosamine 2-epimerase (non-hydrolyzing) [Acidobacteriota bacterium]
MIKTLLIAGARPNFMKVAPIYAEMKRRDRTFAPMIVHTGQHYDKAMSDSFFTDLGMPEPDINLGVGSASHTQQTAKIMTLFEPVAEAERPDWVVVVGDVNSTIACALVAAKMGIKIAHVEAGLRSRDRTMPEEINRILTDSISDLLLTPSPDADETLRREGVEESKIRFVGNVMIDSLLEHLKACERSQIRETLGLVEKGYAVTTLHRPSNVDGRETLVGLVGALAEISERLPIVFPIHPRTRQRIEEFGLEKAISSANIKMVEPLGYLDFLRLYSGAKLVLTDSGGLQEETTVLGIPCLTLRENTERPITIEMGTNVLVGVDPEKILAAAYASLDGPPGDFKIPPLWDGKAAGRICDALEKPAA